MLDHVDAFTFDDFNTLRYQAEEEEDIIYVVLGALQTRIDVNENSFLAAYAQADRVYRRELAETLRESLLDDVILEVVATLGLKLSRDFIKGVVDQALNSRPLCWYADAAKTLLTLRERGYRLGLITNTHWRLPESLRTEFDRYFSVISISHEHGYAKPHPSIFLNTLTAYMSRPLWMIGNDTIMTPLGVCSHLLVVDSLLAFGFREKEKKEVFHGTASWISD